MASSIETFKMKLALFIAVLCCTVLSLASAAQCPTGSLPLRVRGEKSYSSSDQCSNISSQDSLDALQSLNSRVDKEIESVLPRIEAFLTPSPCDGPDWKRVVYINMTNPNHSCPANSGWHEETHTGKRVCDRIDAPINNCGEATFDVDDIIGAYTKICGRIIGFKRGTTEGFGKARIESTSLEEEYVDGVSITHGKNPRHHVWTFAAGLANPMREFEQELLFACPCDILGSPLNIDFIGNNYFCESGGTDSTSGNALWDGNGCFSNSSCCRFNVPPYFVVTLDNPTCDSIDVRMCASEGGEGTPIQLIELYVK